MVPVFIKKTVKEDFPAIKKIFFEAWMFTSDRKITEWGDDFPSDEWLENQLASSSLYSICDYKDAPLGCVCLGINDGDYYSDGERYPALIISTIVFDRFHRGMGCSSTVFMYAERLAKKNGLNKLRLITDESNFIMRSALIRNGFSFRCYTEYGDKKKLCYEKTI